MCDQGNVYLYYWQVYEKEGMVKNYRDLQS